MTTFTVPELVITEFTPKKLVRKSSKHVPQIIINADTPTAPTPANTPQVNENNLTAQDIDSLIKRPRKPEFESVLFKNISYVFVSPKALSPNSMTKLPSPSNWMHAFANDTKYDTFDVSNHYEIEENRAKLTSFPSPSAWVDENEKANDQ
jgi:hypothetical protein